MFAVEIYAAVRQFVFDLPEIDIVLLSHAHFDHFDMRTLHQFDRSTTVITARHLLRWKRFRDVSELRWKERKSVSTSAGKIDIAAFRVKHWGVRTRRDTYRGYNGYGFERNNRRIIFSGDTALSDSFAELRASGPFDLAIMSIGAYNPWIHSPCTRKQAVQMANEAGAHCVMPVHLAITFCRCMNIPARYCTGARGGSAHHAPISQF